MRVTHLARATAIPLSVMFATYLFIFIERNKKETGFPVFAESPFSTEIIKVPVRKCDEVGAKLPATTYYMSIFLTMVIFAFAFRKTFFFLALRFFTWAFVLLKHVDHLSVNILFFFRLIFAVSVDRLFFFVCNNPFFACGVLRNLSQQMGDGGLVRREPLRSKSFAGRLYKMPDLTKPG